MSLQSSVGLRVRCIEAEGLLHFFFPAKKIPLEHYQGAGGRAGSRTASGAAGRGAASNAREGRVNLEDNQQAAQTDGCAC